MQEILIISIFMPLALSIYYNIFPIQGLSALADRKLAFITTGNGWSHDMPECDFRCQGQKYIPNLIWLGENLAKGTGPDWCTKEGVYRQWSKSPPHKHILEEENIKFEIFRTVQIDTMCYSVLERGK